MKEVEKVTEEAMARIIETRQPRGLFYRREARRLYVGVDNNSGDAWTEAFPSRRRCLRWLLNTGLDAKECGALGYGKGTKTSGKVTVREVCAECGFENTLLRNCTVEGYQTKCAECGANLMLCDECQYAPDGSRVDTCDFRWIDQERGIGTCYRREGGTKT